MPEVSDQFIKEYEELVRTVRNINGPGVSVQWGKGISIHKPGKRWERPDSPSSPGGSIIVVNLDADGGDGTVSGPYTYSAFREGSDDPIGEALVPLWRPVPADIESPGAVKGLGDFGGTDGAFRLIVAFETPETEAACEV